MDNFWTNTIWYLLLGVVTVIQVVYALIKAENRSLTFAFYLTVAGITLTFETIILIFFKAYTYYPKILKNPPMPFDDSLAGNLFSQFSVAATVLLVAVFNLNYRWFIILALLYGIIEESFLTLGIYSHNWYRTWMTVILLLLAFWCGKLLYTKIIKGVPPIIYYGYIMFTLFPLYIVTLNWGLMLLRIQTFSKSLLADSIASPYFTALLLFFCLALPLMYIYFSKIKILWKALIILFLYLIYYLGYKTGLITIKDDLFLPISTLVILWIYGSIFAADKLYGYKVKQDSG